MHNPLWLRAWGLLHKSDEYMHEPFYDQQSCGAIEEGVDKRDLAQNAGLSVLDVAAFDRSDRFYAAQGCLCGS